jgi:predicted  nucleic acid-binding Zn-ribbon protein
METTTLLAVLSPIASMAFAFFAFRRNQKLDDGQTGREMGALLSDIGYIKAQLDEVKHKLEASDNRHTELAERISAVEQSAKSAHRRLDALAGKE